MVRYNHTLTPKADVTVFQPFQITMVTNFDVKLREMTRKQYPTQHTLPAAIMHAVVSSQLLIAIIDST